MERAELSELLQPAGMALLNSLEEYTSRDDALKSVQRLRDAGHSPTLIAAVLTQARLRRVAADKFGPFAERMLFTEAGLEQATRLNVAALHAGRFARAGVGAVADLGCGIGGDAMALAALDIAIVAADTDEVTAAIATHNLAPFPNATVLHSRAEDVDLSGIDGVWLDPARRTAGHTDTRRLSDPAAFSPPLSFAYELAKRLPLGMKLGPGFDRDTIPEDAEAQWVSVRSSVVEMSLWFGKLARPGVKRSALVINDTGTNELASAQDSEDAAVGKLGDIIYEPDGAVIRARLIGDLTRKLNARMVHRGIAYLTADSYELTPFARGFRVLRRLPFAERDLRRSLRELNVGTLEIKKRGVDVDPAKLRKKLALRGSESATIILTREASKHIALLVERLD